PFGQMESASRRWGGPFRLSLVCSILTRLHQRKCALLFVIFRCRWRNEYWVGRKSSRLTFPDSWTVVPKHHGQAVSAIIRKAFAPPLTSACAHLRKMRPLTLTRRNAYQ